MAFWSPENLRPLPASSSRERLLGFGGIRGLGIWGVRGFRDLGLRGVLGFGLRDLGV